MRIAREPGVHAVVTVRDLQHEFCPEFVTGAELRHRRRYLPASCAAADHVIAVSEFTRWGVIDRFGIDAGRVTPIWEAAGRDVDGARGPARVAEVRCRGRAPLFSAPAMARRTLDLFGRVWRVARSGD